MQTEVSVRVDSSMATTDDGRLADAHFSADIAPLHTRVNADAWDDIYLVGDVHGCIAELETLLEELAPSDDDLVVFVGDLVRKGPDSAAVVERVRETENFLTVRGNNEQKFVDGEKSRPELQPHYDWFEALPAAISFDDVLVTHGGVDPRRPLAEHDLYDLLETRAIPPENSYDGPFWFELHETRPRVFFGHTVLDAPVVTDGAVGLDTGCVYGGELTAYDYRADELLSVPAERTYQERPGRKILDLPAIQV
jgi:serine/threonine protein phosphatase 1